MPIYEYKCSDCEHNFETKQTMRDKPLKDCPKCKGKINRIIGKNISVSFKGSGFYVTDNKAKNCNNCKENKK